MCFYCIFFFQIGTDGWIKRCFDSLAFSVLQYPSWSTAHHPEHKGDATARQCSSQEREAQELLDLLTGTTDNTKAEQHNGWKKGRREGWLGLGEGRGGSNATVCNAVRHAGQLTDTGNNLRDVRDQQSSSGEHDLVLSEMPFTADVLKAFLRV